MTHPPRATFHAEQYYVQPIPDKKTKDNLTRTTTHGNPILNMATQENMIVWTKWLPARLPC